MTCYDEAEEVKKRLIKKGKINGKVYVCFSGGKDSTAMLLMLIEKGIKFDEIVFADTLLEFPEMYSFIEFVTKKLNVKITTLKPKQRLLNGKLVSLWDYWFYGKITRGERKGEFRSYPVSYFSCWYKREAKVKPMENYMKDADVMYVGIAADETKRQNVKDKRIYHPLVEWNMTEKDCAKYLKKKGFHNPYYDKFNRGGCFLCPKQGDYALWSMWKYNKEEWEKTVFYDNEARRLRGQGGFIRKNKEMKLIDLQKRFEQGFIPKKNLKYECMECKLFVK